MTEILTPARDSLCHCGHGHSAHELATDWSNEACKACNSIEADGNEYPAGEGCQGFSE